MFTYMGVLHPHHGSAHACRGFAGCTDLGNVTTDHQRITQQSRLIAQFTGGNKGSKVRKIRPNGPR